MKNIKSVYVHIPFCIKKCRYCAFCSYQNIFGLQNDYFAALNKQIENCEHEKIETIYIGGGTPSAVNENYICRLLNKIKTHFDVLPDAEITIEANPKTLTKEKIRAYAKSGINRISIGAQSFNKAELVSLGRIHSASDTEKAIRLSEKYGIENTNIDIMYAIPNQTKKSLKETLEKAVSLNTSHISLYGLAIEENTPIFAEVRNGIFTPFSDEEYADMYEMICCFLKENGFVHYEISNFARDEKSISRHNSKYWRGGEYYGIGAGASGYTNGERYSMPCDIEKYIKNPLEKPETEKITKNDEMSEYIILNLRLLKSGISISEFKEKFGCDIFEKHGKKLKFHLENTKMLEMCGKDRIVLAKSAYYVCNSVLCDFI